MQVGRARLSIDGAVVVDNWNPTGRSDAFMGFGSAEVARHDRARRGRAARARGRVRAAGAVVGGLAIGCTPPCAARPHRTARSRSRARADAVVCVVGTDDDWETEGNDRESMALPPPQDELVRAVAAANPRTAIVVNAASPVEMPWADDVGAILQCWFAGEEWGNALADVLSGDVSPSGKLPTTFPARIEDTPAFTNYPGERGEVHYGEGVFVGYRWYDARRIEPRFCFGHGLSYTTFALDPPGVREVATGALTRRRFASRCPYATPARRGARRWCSATCTTSRRRCARPPQELKAFAKVWLDPGETGEVAARARPPRVRVLGRRHARLDRRAGRVRAADRHVVARRSRTAYRSR